MHKSRSGPYFNRSFSNGSHEHNPTPLFEQNRQCPPSAGDKPSFSSLFAGPSPSLNSSFSANHKPNIESFPCEAPAHGVHDDDGGVYLQISNLEQWYNEANLRNYLMSQLKPITPVLSISIETPSIAKVKVPSIQVGRRRQQSNFRSLIVSLLSPTVCKASRVALAPQKDGSQAHFRVLHERQDVG
jgi:hypothetical protein